MTALELINYSEFSTLTQCERKYVYAYVLEQEELGAKKALHTGTLCHLWHANWMLRKGAFIPNHWTDDINTGGKPGEVRTLHLSDFDPDVVERALWLRDRFVAYYGAQPPLHWNVISAEEWLYRDFLWGRLVGRSDGFVEIDGQLVLVELKTYGKRPGPLAYASVSPQLGCYSLLAEAKYGKRPDAVLMQGIYTYRWKPEVPTQAFLIAKAIAASVNADGSPIGALSKADQRAWAKARQADPNTWTERDPSESFEQVEVELGDAHLATAKQYLAAAITRRNLLASSPDEALPNVGRDCSWCGFKARCWSELGGVEEFEIELEDDDDQQPV